MNADPVPRRRRERAKVSLRSVADAMGLSPTYLSDLERGNRPWTPNLQARHRDAVQALGAFRKNPALASQ